MRHGDICLFALDATRSWGERVSAALGAPLSAHEERDFEDGEHKSRPLVSVRGKDVFVVQSLHAGPRQSVDDKLCRLLFFLAALRDASAARVTAVVPYLCYARKDRKTQSRDPVTTRYVAALFEAVEVDRVVTLDVHNLAAFQNAFRCRTEHLEAKRLFVDYFAARVQEEQVAVVSPDVGGIKRAEEFRRDLERALDREVPSAFLEKHRRGATVTGSAVVGEVRNRVAIVVDDLIATGTTLARTVKACRERGAKEIHAAASHATFVGEANQVLADPSLNRIVTTDTIPPFRLDPDLAKSKLTVLESAPLFAQAIAAIHSGGSVVELLKA